MSTNKLQTWFPTTKTPIIISAPMLGAANGTLAAAVSQAGGIGMIPGGKDFHPSSPALKTLEAELSAARRYLSLAEDETLPCGVGFLLFEESITSFIETTIPLLTKHKVRAVWLFAPSPPPPAGNIIKDIIEALHKEEMVVFFQVGNIPAAREAVQNGADVIVAQGVDAGGHQFAKGSGFVSLVPGVVDMLEQEFAERGVVVVAAGGVSEGRGVVAGLGSGAQGVVMGTRFLVADECSTPEYRKQLIIEAEDGGISTAKSTAHDDIQGTTFWPSLYDGRALVGQSYKDHVAGLPLEENVKRFKAAAAKGETGRLVSWAGTGVGLIKKGGPAGDIVREARQEATEAFRRLQGLFQ